MELDYLHFYKHSLTLASIADRDGQPWDCFVSAFNNSQRVRSVFDAARAHRKVWLALPEYGYCSGDFDVGADVFIGESRNEADLTLDFFQFLNVDLLRSRLCVDITGFMRPHIMFLLKYLQANDVRQLDVLYAEPSMYRKRERTTFSAGSVSSVRQIAGYEGVHLTDMSNDVLLVGVGYDHELVARVAGNKDSARLVQIYGLPSLSADMYQQSILRMDQAVDAISGRDFGQPMCYSSANDPFVTASVLRRIVSGIDARCDVTNYYFSPLATKPQTLGFALYFLREMTNRPASVIFPFSTAYERETSTGIGKVWRYEVWLRD